MVKTIALAIAVLSSACQPSDEPAAEAPSSTPAPRSYHFEQHAYLSESQIAELFTACGWVPEWKWETRYTDQPVQPGWTIVQIDATAYMPDAHRLCIRDAIKAIGFESIDSTGGTGYTGLPDGNGSSGDDG